jgi:uncharacterized membrane protein YccF (DUF307 family)
MRLLGNIIWFMLGGWLLFIFYTLAALIFFPVFFPIFRIAKYSLFPFGKEVVYQKDLDRFRKISKSADEYELSNNKSNGVVQGVSGVLNLLWVITFGWILALSHLMAALMNLALFFLVVTIPNISGHWKMMRIAFMPFNTVILPEEIAKEVALTIKKDALKLL